MIIHIPSRNGVWQFLIKLINIDIGFMDNWLGINNNKMNKGIFNLQI